MASVWGYLFHFLLSLKYIMVCFPLNRHQERVQNSLFNYRYIQMAESMPRILVVDDEPGLGDAIAMYLEDLDYEAISMQDAGTALASIRNDCVDIAIVDLGLPDMDGEELIYQAREYCPQLKFIIHTGQVGHQLSEKLLELGIKQDQVLCKPFYTMSEVSELIQRLGV